jgi:hypothetical protein
MSHHNQYKLSFGLTDFNGFVIADTIPSATSVAVLPASAVAVSLHTQCYQNCQECGYIERCGDRPVNF